jgi:hypothetical protein
MWSRSAHISKFWKIHYCYHPLFGKEVEVYRRLNPRVSEEVIVHLPDDTKCALPAWMLDESFCCGLSDADTAWVSMDALRAVATLLDHHASLVGSSGNACNQNLEPKDPKPINPNSSSTDAIAASASKSSAAVPGTAGGDAKKRDRSRTKGGVS